MSKRCKHLSAVYRGDDPVYWFYCPDCTHMIKIGVVFGNWLEEFKRLRKELGKGKEEK